MSAFHASALRARRIGALRRADRSEADGRLPVRGPHAAALSLQVAGNHAVSGLLAGGSPLRDEVRSDMEARFGVDFDSVRVHDGAEASARAAELGASAYTRGEHIFFATQQYAPTSPSGKRLLAHELAHVVQQRKGGPLPQMSRSAPHEREADHAADEVVRGTGPVNIVSGTAPGLACAIPESSAQADTPDEGDPGDEIPRVREVLVAIENTSFDDKTLQFRLSLRGREYVIDHRQEDENRVAAVKAVGSVIWAVQGGVDAIESEYGRLKEVNSRWYYSWIATATTKFYGVEDPDEELATAFAKARYYAKDAEAAVRGKRYSYGLDQAELARDAALEAVQILEDYQLRRIEGSKQLYNAIDGVLKSLRNVAIGVGAVLLAPETFGGSLAVVGGLGLAGGASEAGVDLAQQAIEGKGLEVNRTLKKSVAGTRDAVVAATAGLVTAGTANYLGPGTNLLQTSVRGGAAGGVGGLAGGGLKGALEGKAPAEIAKGAVISGVEGTFGGTLGGASTTLIGGLRLPTRVALGALGGGAVGGAGSFVAGKLEQAVGLRPSGRSGEELLQAVFGGIAGGAISARAAISPRSATVEEGALAQTRQVPPSRSPQWEEFGVDIDHGIEVYRSGDDFVGRHPDYPETLFVLQPEGLPKVYVRGKGGDISEAPWPFSQRPAGDPVPTQDASPGSPLLTASPRRTWYSGEDQALHPRPADDAGVVRRGSVMSAHAQADASAGPRSGGMRSARRSDDAAKSTPPGSRSDPIDEIESPQEAPLEAQAHEVAQPWDRPGKRASADEPELLSTKAGMSEAQAEEAIREHLQRGAQVSDDFRPEAPEPDEVVSGEDRRNAQTAGVTSNVDQHHVFPQTYRGWFVKRGMEGANDIDNFCVDLPKEIHDLQHYGLRQRIVQRRFGVIRPQAAIQNPAWLEWNVLVMRSLRRAEAIKTRRFGPDATLVPSEIRTIVFDLMLERGIPQDFRPYRAPREGSDW